METVFPKGAILEMAFELAGIIVLELQEKRQGIAIGEILVGRGQDPAPGAGLESLDQVVVEKVQSRALDKRDGEGESAAMGKAFLQMGEEGDLGGIAVKGMVRHQS